MKETRQIQQNTAVQSHLHKILENADYSIVTGRSLEVAWGWGRGRVAGKGVGGDSGAGWKYSVIDGGCGDTTVYVFQESSSRYFKRVQFIARTLYLDKDNEKENSEKLWTLNITSST